MRFVFFLICAFSISCNSNVVKITNSENTRTLSIKELFLLLPDEAFYIAAYQRTVYRKERQLLLQSTTIEQAVTLSSNYVMDIAESSDNFLAFSSLGDEGIYVCLKTWQRKDQSLIVGVNISVGDHCCDYSTLKLFHYKDAGFEEVTERIFPKLKIEDFVPDIAAKTKALLPSPIEVTINIAPKSEFLEISIHHTPMMFDLETFDDLEKELAYQVVQLAWKKDQFFIYDTQPYTF